MTFMLLTNMSLSSHKTRSFTFFCRDLSYLSGSSELIEALHCSLRAVILEPEEEDREAEEDHKGG